MEERFSTVRKKYCLLMLSISFYKAGSVLEAVTRQIVLYLYNDSFCKTEKKYAQGSWSVRYTWNLLS